MHNVPNDSPTLKSYVKSWMRSNTDEHLDCGEVNLTGLAENAAHEFDVYEEDSEATIPEWVFEMAVDVAIIYEEQA
jgi:hypothetical protein